MANEMRIGQMQREIRFVQASLELECPLKYAAGLDWHLGERTLEQVDAAEVGDVAENVAEVEAVRRDGNLVKD